MDAAYVIVAARYIALNPIRAGLVDDPLEYPWSSAKAHVRGRDDVFVSVSPLLELVAEWEQFLHEDITDRDGEPLCRHERTGRSLGAEAFIARLEGLLGRSFQKQKLGPKGPWKHKKNDSLSIVSP